MDILLIFSRLIKRTVSRDYVRIKHDCKKDYEHNYSKECENESKYGLASGFLALWCQVFAIEKQEIFELDQVFD